MRKPEYPVHDMILNRWSPRAMSGEPITEEELMSLFEAAKWAPSAFNEQPWRFIYAQRDTEHWDTLFNLLMEGNQSWTSKAAALAVVISRNLSTHNEKPFKTHTFDTGAAWENLALQAASMNLVAHGMAGFHYDKAKTVLKIPDHYTVEAMIAIGKPGKKEELPEALQEREAPSDRRPLKETVMEGVFSGN